MQSPKREAWLAKCRTTLYQFQQMAVGGMHSLQRVQYVREQGQSVGAVILTKNSRGKYCIGASYCSKRDRKRFTKIEALHRAVMSLMPVDLPVFSTAFTGPDSRHFNEWLKFLPPSCRASAFVLLAETSRASRAQYSTEEREV